MRDLATGRGFRGGRTIEIPQCLRCYRRASIYPCNADCNFGQNMGNVAFPRSVRAVAGDRRQPIGPPTTYRT